MVFGCNVTLPVGVPAGASPTDRVSLNGVSMAESLLGGDKSSVRNVMTDELPCDGT